MPMMAHDGWPHGRGIRYLSSHSEICVKSPALDRSIVWCPNEYSAVFARDRDFLRQSSME